MDMAMAKAKLTGNIARTRADDLYPGDSYIELDTLSKVERLDPHNHITVLEVSRSSRRGMRKLGIQRGEESPKEWILVDDHRYFLRLTLQGEKPVKDE